METELKPCPSCRANDDDNIYEMTLYLSVKMIGCAQCGLKGPTGGAAEARDKWNALPRRPRYEKRIPTEPGWYWRNKQIVKVYRFQSRLWADWATGKCTIDDDGEKRSDVLWAGPIPEPEAANG
jgi:hypothetical protein